MLSRGQLLSLTIERPAAGGRMIARADGQIVFVSGAIPGERVQARIERTAKGMAWARTESVEEASAQRRQSRVDPECAGFLYNFIAYETQLALKAEVVADALRRIGRTTWSAPIAVAPSPESGYRMRARLHLRAGRLGFFNERSHQLCDVRATGQLLPASVDALDALLPLLAGAGVADAEIELSENIPGSQRAVYVESSRPVDPDRLGETMPEGLTGLLCGTAERLDVSHGDGVVTDSFDVGGRTIHLGRHVRSFFQGNRHLLAPLLEAVAGVIDEGREVVDLYAGAGLFSLGASARGVRVTAVEGDRSSAGDLFANVERAGAGPALTALHQSVEEFVAARPPRTADVVIVDPPRSGLSTQALDGVIRLAAPLLVYVSCDVATFARDVRRLLDAGYRLDHLEAFDLFPNTPHVETLALLRR